MGSTHAGQRVNGRRCLAAGESRRGGALRDSPTGRSLAREARIWDADARPHPTVVVARSGSGRSGAGDDLGGRRSSGEDEPEATGHGEARGVVR